MNLFEFAQKKQDEGDRQTYDELLARIKRNNELYYADAEPEIEDAEYDRLYRELEAMEAAHPDWVTPDSPTQKVGNDLSANFAKIRHALPMQSIDDIFEQKPEQAAQTDIELIDFYASLQRQLGGEKPCLGVEPKIDGCAITLLYRGGRLDYAATRGDGQRGDDITANMRMVESIPQQLPEGAPALLEVRGEIFMRYADFETLNQRREAEGLAPFANPRNLTAGTIKLLDKDEFATRKLDFLAHGLGQYEGAPLRSTQDFCALLKSMNIPLNEPIVHVDDLDGLRAAVVQVKHLREHLGYATDGAVIKLDDFALRAQLGSTARAPRWAAAFKFLPEQKVTRLKAITVQVGRTGVMTPVAELEPVALSGTTVSRATLHNQDEIDRKRICVGDEVLVEKAGEIIPSIVKSMVLRADAYPGIYNLYDALEGKCPSCGEPLSQQEGQVAWRCTNFICPAQAAMRTMYFARRECLDIANLGESVAVALQESGMIRSPLDLFSLGLANLAQLNLGSEAEPRYLGEKNAVKILAALNRARSLGLEQWLTAMGIAQIGVETARSFAKYHRDWQTLADSDYFKICRHLESLCLEYAAIKPVDRELQGAHLRDVMQTLAAPWQQRGYLELAMSGKTMKAKMVLKPALGEEVAMQSLLAFFASASGQQLLSKMRGLGINPVSASYRENWKEVLGGALTGLTFVITGSLSQPRPQFKKMIEAAGGKVTGSVTAKTNYLLAGAGGGDKRRKADSLQVPIIGEDELNVLMQS